MVITALPMTAATAETPPSGRNEATNLPVSPTYEKPSFSPATHMQILIYKYIHMWVPYAGIGKMSCVVVVAGFNIYLFVSASRNALKAIK